MLPKDLSKLAGVQYCQEYIKAQQVRDAANDLLEALKQITSSDRAIHLREEDYFKAIAAINKATGEV